MSLKVQAKISTPAKKHNAAREHMGCVEKGSIFEVLEVIDRPKYNMHGDEIHGTEPFFIVMLGNEKVEVFPPHFSKV